MTYELRTAFGVFMKIRCPTRDDDTTKLVGYWWSEDHAIRESESLSRSYVSPQTVVLRQDGKVFSIGEAVEVQSQSVCEIRDRAMQKLTEQEISAIRQIGIER